MGDFTAFDTRGYPVVGTREGYGAWARDYEGSVEDAMDVELLAALDVDWAAAGRVVDLGCGTGRTGAFLRGQGAGAEELVGVDVTPEMLAGAAARGAHSRLLEADVRDTGLEAGRFALAVTSLVDEHLPDLRPLYAEAARLLAPGGTYVLVGIHPHFQMATGMPTHFHREDGAAVAIETHLHLLGDHVAAARAAGLALEALRERTVDDGWAAAKPKWARWRGHPVSFAWTWRR